MGVAAEINRAIKDGAMSIRSEFCNLFRTEGLDGELDEEFQAHVYEAVIESRDRGIRINPVEMLRTE